MMEKLLHFDGLNSRTGSVFTQIVRPGRAGMSKMAQVGQLHPDVQRYIRDMDAKPGHTYVLNNALGSWEVYGSNINGDTFPEDGLLNGHSALQTYGLDDVPGRTAFAKKLNYGYATFYTAHIFQHHANKDPSKTLGVICLVVWNPVMHRVEVIFDLDHELCRAQGAWGLIERINSGDFPMTSMGCKVPDDRCSICGNRAKTRHQYCKHVNNKDRQFGMNKILPDGRKCCVHNDKPRFFDDSFVTIGADKTAFVMAKIASGSQKYWLFTKEGLALPSALRGELYYGEDELTKTAGVVKQAAPIQKLISKLPFMGSHLSEAEALQEIDNAKKIEDEMFELRVKKAGLKIGEMLKQLPPGPSHLLTRLEQNEKPLPDSVLDGLAQAPSLSMALSAPTRAGIVLRPEEYQRVCLTHGGMGSLARELSARRVSFNPYMGRPTGMHPVAGGHPLSSIMSLIRPLLGMARHRSCCEPVIRRRLTMLIIEHPPEPVRHDTSPGVMQKLADGYADYRESVMTSIPEIVEGLSHPEIKEAVLRNETMDLRAGLKTASAAVAVPLAGLAVLGSLVYLNAAHWKSQKEMGQDLGLIKSLVADHPSLVTALAAGVGTAATLKPAAVEAAVRALA